MSADPVTRLNAALEGRYRIESELGEGTRWILAETADSGDSTSVADRERHILVVNWFTELRERTGGS